MKKMYNKGQTLAVLLVFMVVAITVISAAATLILVNSTAIGKFEEGLVDKVAAESGVENALIKILRDPTYAGETFSIEDSTVAVAVSGAETKTIESTATRGNFSRTIEVNVTLVDGILTINSWQESF